MNVEIQSNRERDYPPPGTANLLVDGRVMMYGVPTAQVERIAELLESGRFEDSEAWEIAESIRATV